MSHGRQEYECHSTTGICGESGTGEKAVNDGTGQQYGCRSSPLGRMKASPGGSNGRQMYWLSMKRSGVTATDVTTSKKSPGGIAVRTIQEIRTHCSWVQTEVTRRLQCGGMPRIRNPKPWRGVCGKKCSVICPAVLTESQVTAWAGSLAHVGWSCGRSSRHHTVTTTHPQWLSNLTGMHSEKTRKKGQCGEMAYK